MANTKLAVKLKSDTGLSSSDLISRSGALQVSGALKGDQMFYRWSSDGGTTWTSWSATSGSIASPSTDGNWQVQVQERAKSGSIVENRSLSFTLDTTVAAPKVGLVTDTGASASDLLTSQGQLKIEAESGAKIEYSLNNGVTWSSNFKATEGFNQVWVRQTDLAGNLSATKAFSFTLDTHAAVAPVVGLNWDSTDGGLGHDQDNITQDASLKVGGVEAGATLQYSADGVHWAASFAAQEGSNTVWVHQLDQAGNASAASTLTFTQDTTGPAAQDDQAQTATGVAVTVYALGNDSDSSGAVSVAGYQATSAYGASVTDNGDGSFTYQSAAGFVGLDSFAYQVTDLAGNVSQATVWVDVVDGGAVPVDPPVVPTGDGTSPFVVYDPQVNTVGQLTQALLGLQSGIQMDPATIVLHASGTGSTNFYDGSLAPLGIGAGLLLTSGTTPGTVNTSTSFGSDNGGAYGGPGYFNGDADLDAVVNTVFGTTSYDATTLSFDFVVTDPTAKSVSFNLVFGSDEFPEWVDAYVDSAIVMVNGQNVALFNHDAMSPLSVIGSNLAAGYFQNNTSGVLPIEYDGVSKVLTIVAPIQAGTNTIKIGVGDTGDHILDSGIFIANLKAGNWEGSGVLIEDHDVTPGDDTLSGSDASDLVNLGTGNDAISTGAGDDIVDGGSGKDHISGGSGNDVLTGGTGADDFDYTVLSDWAAFGDSSDTVTDFAANQVLLLQAADLDATDGDVLAFSYTDLASLAGVNWLENNPGAACFSTLSSGSVSGNADGTADQAQAQFVYDASTGWVGFDVDGTGSQAAMAVTLLGNHPASLGCAAFVMVG